LVFESVVRDELRSAVDRVGEGVGVVEWLSLTTLSSISVSEEDEEEISGEAGRRVGTDEEVNSRWWKWDSTVVGNGGWERWFVISDIDVRFLPTVVGSMDTCCCFGWLFVRLRRVNWSFWLPFVVLELRLVVVEELDRLSFSSCSKIYT
jgi:hypothetical protein